ncbi:MAG TPA: type II toxin-antitoxin system prevent-host-death family antitoxin [Xanthobacteraceae bacterium]
MRMTALTSREFNRDPRGAKKFARQGPVVITVRGRSAHVLLTIEDYRRLGAGSMSLAEALAQPSEADFDFAPQRVGDGIFKRADLD